MRKIEENITNRNARGTLETLHVLTRGQEPPSISPRNKIEQTRQYQTEIDFQEPTPQYEKIEGKGKIRVKFRSQNDVRETWDKKMRGWRERETPAKTESMIRQTYSMIETITSLFTDNGEVSLDSSRKNHLPTHCSKAQSIFNPRLIKAEIHSFVNSTSKNTAFNFLVHIEIFLFHCNIKRLQKRKQTKEAINKHSQWRNRM